MAGYNDTRDLIISALMGRPAGTEIQPENHQAYALNMLDYIRSLELVSTSTLIGIAESNTVPVQPNASRVCYIAGVAQNQTVTFNNFRGQNGNPITITTGDMEGLFVILMWNMQYWDVQTFNTNIISQNVGLDDGSIELSKLSPTLASYIGSGGQVTNQADDDDLENTIINGVPVIREKTTKIYNPETYSGMGRVILRKNMVNGVNVLTQEMINQANTIYEIRYDFDLNGADIQIKDGCVLSFVGGSLKNGTIKGEVVINDENKKQLFYNINTTISNSTIKAEWFGEMLNDITCDSSIAINKAIQSARLGSTVELPSHNIYIKHSIVVNKAIILNGNTTGVWAHKIYVASNDLTAIIVDKKKPLSGGKIKNIIIARKDTDISFIGVEIQTAEHFTVENVSVESGRIGFFLSGVKGPLYLVNLNKVSARYCSEYGIYLDEGGSWKNGVHIHPLDVSFNNTNIRVCKGSGNTIQGGATEIGGYLSNADRPSWLTENNGIVIEGGIWTIKDYLWIENCNKGIWVKSGYVNIIDDVLVSSNTCFEDDAVVRYKNQSMTKKLHKSKINDLVDYAEIIVDGDNTFPTLNGEEIIENFKNYGSANNMASGISSSVSTKGYIKKMGGIDTRYYIEVLGTSYWIEAFFSKDNIRQFTFLVDFKLNIETDKDVQIFAIYLSDGYELRIVSSIVTHGLSPRFVKLVHTGIGYLGNLIRGSREHVKGFVRYVFSVDLDTKTIWQYDDESGLLLGKTNFSKDDNINNTMKKCIIANGEIGISKLYVFSKLLNQSEINTILNTKKLLVNDENYLTDTNSDIISKFNGNQFYDIKNDCLKLKTSEGVKNIQIANNVTALKALDNSSVGTMLFYKNRPTWWDGTKWINNNGYNSEYLTKGTTAQRPILTSTDEGFEYYDSTLKKKILWNGSGWVNLDGTALT